jgi:outer membrane receptor protein involved in Fe transport
VYLQDLTNVPVEKRSSSFSLLNTGAGFSRFFPEELINSGTGRNVGAEITVEKFFSEGWLFLFTASVFDSKYKGSDGVSRNTDFNGKYAANFLASKEWEVKQKNAFVLGMKLTTAGGRWYGPADIDASNLARDLVFIDSQRNTLQFDPYFRFDIKINYRINAQKIAHEIGLDLVNVLNTKNILKLTYAPDESGDPTNSIREEYQLGFLPVFFYKVDF